MRALGFEVKKADVLKVMKEYDKEATGKITFDDFYEVSKYYHYGNAFLIFCLCIYQCLVSVCHMHFEM